MKSLNVTLPSYPPTIETVASSHDTNPGGDIFGGWMMGQMDMAGGSRAFAYAGSRVVTAGVNELSFLKPVFAGDRLRFYTHIARVGRTSIAVDIQAWRASAQDQAFEIVAGGVYTFVAVDDKSRPVPISHISHTMAAA